MIAKKTIVQTQAVILSDLAIPRNQCIKGSATTMSSNTSEQRQVVERRRRRRNPEPNTIETLTYKLTTDDKKKLCNKSCKMLIKLLQKPMGYFLHTVQSLGTQETNVRGPESQQEIYIYIYIYIHTDFFYTFPYISLCI